MQIVPIKISLTEAIEARVKRSEMITLDDIDRREEQRKRIHFDAYLLRPIYYKFIEEYEKRLGAKAHLWSKETIEMIEWEFINKYYKNGKLTI